MTDDLKKRFRDHNVFDYADWDAVIDRIEELEAALREIVDCVTLPAQNDFEMREIARKALEGKND